MQDAASIPQNTKTHVITYTQPGSPQVWIYGDGLITTDKAQALRLTEQDAKALAARLEASFNRFRALEGIEPSAPLLVEEA